MSVGHSRRTSRKPSPHHCGRVGEQLLEVALDAVLLERRRLAHVVLDVERTSSMRDLEPVLAPELADDDGSGGSPSISITVGRVIQLSGL